MEAALAVALLIDTGLRLKNLRCVFEGPKLVVERNPSMYVAVSRHLGHGKVTTTRRCHHGSETAAASRKPGRILCAVRDNPKPDDSGLEPA